MQRDCILAGDRDCIFLWGNGLCVQQPWQNISPWSVADRFLSTFSFILICSSSLSRTHAENEVSRLRTAPQPTCRVSLFSLPIHFMLGSRLFQTQRKCRSSTTVFSILPSPALLLKEKNKQKKLYVETKGSLFFYSCQTFSSLARSTFMLKVLLSQAAPCSAYTKEK